eukprot:3779257-Rhodomonas_salina.1
MGNLYGSRFRSTRTRAGATRGLRKRQRAAEADGHPDFPECNFLLVLHIAKLQRQFCHPDLPGAFAGRKRLCQEAIPRILAELANSEEGAIKLKFNDALGKREAKLKVKDKNKEHRERFVEEMVIVNQDEFNSRMIAYPTRKLTVCDSKKQSAGSVVDTVSFVSCTAILSTIKHKAAATDSGLSPAVINPSSTKPECPSNPTSSEPRTRNTRIGGTQAAAPYH